MNHSRRRATDENLREFELFFRRHYEHLTQYVSRRTPFSQVDDLVSTTFIIAWKKFHQTKNPTLPWLLQIAKYEIANKRRSERTRQNNVTLINVEEFPETRRGGDFDGDEVVSALLRLSPSDQEVLRLVHWDGLSRDDAAKALGVRVNTANVRYRRALRRLQSQVPSQRTDKSGSVGSSSTNSSFLKEVLP